MKEINFRKVDITPDEVLKNIIELIKRQDSKETLIDYMDSYMEELRSEDFEIVGKSKIENLQNVIENASDDITELSKKLTAKTEQITELKNQLAVNVEEEKKSLELLKEKDKAIGGQLKTIESLEKENENLKSQKSVLDALVKEKGKIIKELKKKANLKVPVKKVTRDRGKTKKTAEDIDIDDVLKEGLS